MRKFVPALLRLTLCSLFACSGGCAVGALLDKTTGDPKEPAKYVPEHENVVVMVEDYQNPALIEELVDHIDSMISEELIANKVAPLINPEKLTLFRLDHPADYKKTKIADIGARLGARQLIYADVTDFTVVGATGSNVVKGHAEARVKVVDCVSGLTRWPKDSSSAGYPVVVDIPFTAAVEDVHAPAIREVLSRELASRIAKLFYNATIEQSDSPPRYPETDLH